jgi:hypothetical protein
MQEERTVTLRRSLEQVIHCCQEALSVIVNKEDINCAIDDIYQAKELLKGKVIRDLVIMKNDGKL